MPETRRRELPSGKQMKRNCAFPGSVLARGEIGKGLECSAKMRLVIEARFVCDSCQIEVFAMHQINSVKKPFVGKELFRTYTKDAHRLSAEVTR